MSDNSRLIAVIAVTAIGGAPAYGAAVEITCSGDRVPSRADGQTATQLVIRTCDDDLARRRWREGQERDWKPIIAYGGGRAKLAEYHRGSEYRLAFIGGTATWSRYGSGPCGRSHIFQRAMQSEFRQRITKDNGIRRDVEAPFRLAPRRSPRTY